GHAAWRVLPYTCAPCFTRSGGASGAVSPSEAESAADACNCPPGSVTNTDAGALPDAGSADDAGSASPDGGALDGGNLDAGPPPIGPHVLAADEKAEALALDSTNLYWVNDPGPQGSSRFALRTVRKSGGTPTTLAEVDRQVNDLVADDEAERHLVGAYTA